MPRSIIVTILCYLIVDIVLQEIPLFENSEDFLKRVNCTLSAYLPMPGMMWNLSLTSGSTAAVTIFTFGYA